MRLVNKVAVVTGGNSGIGLAIAERFVAEGARVFITGRRQDALDAAVARIGGSVEAIQGDLTIDADVSRLIATLADRAPKLDILVANAGMIEPLPFGEITADNFDRTFALNARAPLFVTQAALPLMGESGSIVLIGSTAGYIGLPGYSAYSATKAALRSYARTWTKEFGARGIRVNVLSPGPVETPVVDGQADAAEIAAFQAQYAAMIPLGRWGRPEEIAAAALFLASDESSFVAGAELSIDGGMSQI